MLHMKKFHNFKKYPLKAYKISVPLPYYTYLLYVPGGPRKFAHYQNICVLEAYRGQYGPPKSHMNSFFPKYKITIAFLT